MKQILMTALTAVAVLLSSCSKDDNDPTRSNPIKISIGGAKYIYVNPNSTKASSGELAQFMAVNDKGESKPIRFLNADNDTIDMAIDQIKDLGNEYVILTGDFRYTDQTGRVQFRTMLANKKTELVYAMNVDFAIYGNKHPTYVDQNNNLYQRTDIYDAMIYQYNVSDPNNIRLSEYIPDNQEVDDYIVNERGFCFYGSLRAAEFKIKCPGGRIYTSSELLNGADDEVSVFRGCKNDTFFIIEHKYLSNPVDNKHYKIICYELVENGLNELVTTQRSEIYCSTNYDTGVISNAIQKTQVMNTRMFNDYNPPSKVLEYNEETQKFNELNMQLPYIYKDYSGEMHFTRNNTATTKNVTFIYDQSKNELVILKLADNAITRINLVGKYELYSMDGDVDSDEVTFSGLRFSDGRNIVGTIDQTGQFHAIETINATKETVLIRLN